MASVYARVLGTRLDQLDQLLRAYFTLEPGRVGHGTGIYEVAGSRVRWLRPVWAWLGWRGVLFPEYGRDIPFTVVNTPRADGTLGAVRRFELPGRTREMLDRMSVVDGVLHDRLGRRGGLEVAFALDVAGGALQMTSGRQWLHLGALRLRVPAWVRVHLTESVRSGRQHVDVRMTAPLLGEVFRYSGGFDFVAE